MGIKIIITGATGMVGEGVLLECLQQPSVEKVLVVGRRPYSLQHPKLQELIVPDFFQLDKVQDRLSGYDACFYCAGISAIGMKEAEYSRITYDTTLHFATLLARLNPAMVFNYVSGQGTDSSGKGRMMWARVKGKTENALLQLPFKAVYNFRPGMMKPTHGQKNIKPIFKFMAALYPFFHTILPNSTSTLSQVGQAMINTVLKGADKPVLEVKDIKLLAKG
jgi:uncharacterized protein YbjT (DUF2867 family)